MGLICQLSSPSPPGINAQARKLQRNRTKGTMTLLAACHTSPPSLRRTVSETSLSQAGPPEDQKKEGPLRRHYSTLPETLRCMEGVPDGRASAATEEANGSSTLRLSLYQSPHLLLLQGYSQQHVSVPSYLRQPFSSCPPARCLGLAPPIIPSQLPGVLESHGHD